MKQRKRLVAWLLAILMFITSVPSSTFASAPGSAEPVSQSESFQETDGTSAPPETTVGSETKAGGETSAESQPETKAVSHVESRTDDESQSDTSQTGQSDTAQTGQSDSTSETAQTKETSAPVRRSPADYTGSANVLELHLEKAQYQSSGQKQTVKAANDRLDLSGLLPAVLNDVTLSVYFRLHNDKVEGGMIGGDTFHITVPEKYFHIENTSAPVAVYNCEPSDHDRQLDKLLGHYEIKNNVLTFTADAAVEKEAAALIMGTLKVKVSVKEKALTKDEAVKVSLHNNKLEILLPKLSEDKGSAESESDTTESKKESAQSESETAQSETAPAESESAPVQSETAPAESESAPAQSETDPAQSETIAESESASESVPESESGDNGSSTLARSFRGLIGGASILASAPPKAAANDTKTTHIFRKGEIPDAFEEIKLTVYSKDGGYSTADQGTNPFVTFAYNVYMDETVLYEMSEEIGVDSTFPLQGDDTRAWLENVKDWLAKNPSYPNIEYSYYIGDRFIDSPVYDLTMNQYDLPVGNFYIKDGNIVVSMNPVCCFLDNVFFEFSIKAALNEASLKEKPEKAIVADNGELLFETIGTAGGDQPPAEDPKYVVEKEAPVRVTGTTIDYKITVNAREGERLNGLTLKDAIPEGLEVLSANMELNGGSQNGGRDIPLTGDEAQSGEYTFEPYDEKADNAITSAVFSLTMGLNNETYTEYMKNGINRTFTNKASLMGQELDKPLAGSEPVDTKMTARFIEKDGRVSNLDGTRYAWNIHVQTLLPALDHGYLVDTISWTDHMYDFDSGIQVTADGKTYTIKDVTKLDSGVSWEKLSIQALDSMTGDASSFDTGAPKAFYYLIDDPVSNPFAELSELKDERANKQRAVLIIPYTGLHGTDKDKDVTIKYSTKLNMHGLAPQDYWNFMSGKDYSPAVDNKVNLLWVNKEGGIGPVALLQENVNFGKDVAPKTGAIIKKGLHYDEKTQMLTWSIDVNKLGIDMTEVVVTDFLPEAAYDLGESFTVNWYKYSRSSQSQVDAGTYTIGNGCSLADAGADRKLNIDLGDVGADSIYTLTFSAKLTDAALLSQHTSQHSQGLTAANKAEISYKTGGVPKDYAVVATMPLTNTLIEKQAVGAYDYHTHALTWKVTVNPNSLSIKGAEVTDTLETGFTFGEVTAVTYGGKEDAARLADLQAQAQQPGFDTSAPVFNLGDIDAPYTISFTAIAGNDWRDTHLKKNTDGSPLPVTVPNTARLDGSIGGTAITGAVDSANNTVTINPIGKSGVYNKKEGTIAWTLEINREQYDLSGLRLVENLLNPDGSLANENAIHELDADTLRICRLETDGAGKVLEKDVTADEVTLEASVSPDGFTYAFNSIGGQGNYNTYRIYFTTVLTGDAFGQTIANRVYLNDNSGDPVNSSATSDGGYDGSFELDKYSGATPRPSVRLRKVSTNSRGETTTNSLGLDGATFVLEVRKFRIQNGVLELGDVVQKFTKSRATVDGGIYFTNIKTSASSQSKANDLICVVRETEAAPGYINDERPRFIYFYTKDGNQIKESFSAIEFNGEKYTGADIADLYQTCKIDEGDKTLKTVDVSFKNEPVETKYTLYKHEADWSTYTEDANGKATWGTKPAPAGVTFTITPLNQKDKLEEKTVATDSEGKIVLSGFDAGEYLITETKASTGMKPGTIKMTVTWSTEKNTYEYSFSEPDGLNFAPIGVVEGMPKALLTNGLSTTNVSFTKYAGYEKGTGTETVSDNQEPLAGVKFKIVSTAPTGLAGIPADKVNRTVTSGSDGKVTFTNLPMGNYNIYELYGADAKPGYEANGSEELVYALSVTEAANDDGTGQKLVYTMTPKRSSGVKQDTDKICYNKPILGTISFTKTIHAPEASVKAFDDKPLAGAKFGLFRKIGGNVAKDPLAKATSDANGLVEFTGVEYGDYVIKELSVPVGYTKLDSDITVTRNDMTINTSGNSGSGNSGGDAPNPDGPSAATSTGFTCQLPGVKNKLYTAPITLQKTDRDGQPMTNVAFDIYRRGGKAVEGAGSYDIAGNELMSFAENTDIYSRCSGLFGDSVLTTDNNGKITLEDVPVGDYLFVEQTAGLDLQDGKNQVAVHISVYPGSNGAYQIQVCENHNVSLSGDKVTLTDAELASDDWKPVTGNGKENSNIYTIVNQKKYGYVNLNKVVAEQSSGGEIKPKPDIPVSGAVFEIYQKHNGTVTPKPYLTLKTNANGQFDYTGSGDNAGAYFDVVNKTYKHLWYGDYIIKEVTVPDGLSSAYEFSIEFTIGDGTTGHEGFAWISLDPSNADTDKKKSVTYKKANEAALAPAVNNYANIAKRGSLFLKKSDKDQPDKPVSGAIFEVRVKADTTELTVARLVESDEPGIYKLTNEDANGILYDQKNANGVPYVDDVDGQLKLLVGDYIIEETETPAGYVTPVNPKTEITLGDSGLTLGSQNGLSASLIDDSLAEATTNATGISVTNTQTYLEVAKLSEDKQPVAGAQLAIYEWDDYASKKGKLIHSWTSNGQSPEVIRGKLSEGDYILEETQRPEGYFKADSIVFTLKPGNVLEIQPDPSGVTNGSLAGNTLTMTDRKISENITINKTITGGAPAANVAFELYKVGSSTPEATMVTDSNGALSFTGLTEGSYIIKEGLQASLDAHVADDIHINESWQATVEITTDEAQTRAIVKVDGEKLEGPISVTNDLFGASLSLTKTDEQDGTPLAGVTFLLEKKDGHDYTSYIQESNKGLYTTDARGELHIENLTRGKYRITEKETIYGYELDKNAPFTAVFTVDNAKQGKELVITKTETENTGADSWSLQVTSGSELLTDSGLTNLRTPGTVTLKKVDSKDSAGLDGVVYTLYKKQDGNWLTDAWNFITGKQYESVADLDGSDLDEEGRLTISGLEWGEYKLVEKTQLNGYIRDTAAYKFTIGRTTPDIVLNVDKGIIANAPTELTLIKQDINGRPLNGAKFLLANTNDPEDTVEASIDTHGRTVLTRTLRTGAAYTVTETTVPAGYEKIIDFTLTMGEDGRASIADASGLAALSGNVLTITNKPVELGFGKAGDGGTVLDGAKFTVTGKFAATPADGNVTTEDGTVTVAADGQTSDALKGRLVAGETYTVSETEIPAGYTKAADFQFTVNSDGTIVTTAGTYAQDILTIADTMTRFAIYKHDGDTPVADTRFSIAPAAGSSFADGSREAMEISTGADGKYVFEGILCAGATYELTELQAAPGYVTPVGGKAVFTVSSDGRSLTLENENTLGAQSVDETLASAQDNASALAVANTKTRLEISKVDDLGNALTGAQLAIYKWDPQTGKKDGEAIKTWISEASAKVFVGEIAEGAYVLEETARPAGYLLADPVYFTMTAGNKVTLIPGPDEKTGGQLTENTLTMTDVKILGDITVNKITSDAPQSPVANVAFDLYSHSENGEDTLVATLVTDAGGRLSFTDIPEGSYIIRENLQASLDAGVADDIHINENWQAKVEITTDDAQKTPVIKIDGDASDGQLSVANDRFSAALSMTKTDADDGTALAGVTFLLEKMDGQDYTPYIQESNAGLYKTDANGQLHIEGLTRGQYRLTESAAVYGYELDENAPFTAIFTVDNTKQGRTLVITKTEAEKNKAEAVNNEAEAGNSKAEAGNSKARIENSKAGAGISGTDFWNLQIVTGSELLTDSGLTNIRTLGSVTLKKVDSKEAAGLDGVVYTLYKKQDGSWFTDVWNFITGKQYESVADLDGSNLNEDGRLTINGLTWGQYKLVEKTAQAGYILDTAEYTFELGRINTAVTLNVDKGIIENVQNEVTLEKRGTDLLPGANGRGSLLDGAVFTITNTSNDSSVETITVTGGAVTLSGLLTGGETYELQEIKAPVGYQLNPETIRFTMGTDGQIRIDDEPLPGNVLTVYDEPTVLTFTKLGLYNELCADAGISGIDADATIPLAGAEFSAYAKDAPETAVAVAVSDSTGTVTFKGLPLGSYFIKETKAPEGYRIDTNTYTADVISGDVEGLRDENGEAIKDNTLINDVYRTDIRFTKVNEKKPSQVLAGSTYGLYKKLAAPAAAGVMPAASRMAAPAGEAPESGWQLIATAVTNEQGLLEFNGVLMDTEYMIRELASPDGSYVSAHPMKLTFTLDEKGEVQTKSFDDGSGTTVMDPETGEITWLEPPVEVSFTKQDENGTPLAGAVLQVQDEAGNVIEQWTSAKDAHMISGVLVVGTTYKLVEVKAPAGYNLAEPITFTVDDTTVAPGANKMISVTMTDTPIVLTLIKTDADGKVLEGAAFKIQGAMADGSSSMEVAPGKNGIDLKAMLVAGNMYTITETQSPDGYVKLTTAIELVADESGALALADKNSSATLTKKDDGYALVITNKKAAAEPEKKTQKPAGGNGVKTGDETPLAPLFALCAASLGTVIYIRRRKKTA